MDKTLASYGTGRRKTSVARVYLRELKDKEEASVLANRQELKAYFRRDALVDMLSAPLHATESADRFKCSIYVRGGGISSQAGAVRHGLARALVKFNEEWRPCFAKMAFSLATPGKSSAKKSVCTRPARPRNTPSAKQLHPFGISHLPRGGLSATHLIEIAP